MISLDMKGYSALPRDEKEAWEVFVTAICGDYTNVFQVDVDENAGWVTIHRYVRDESTKFVKSDDGLGLKSERVGFPLIAPVPSMA